jgi:hypothetical protein
MYLWVTNSHKSFIHSFIPSFDSSCFIHSRPFAETHIQTDLFFETTGGTIDRT